MAKYGKIRLMLRYADDCRRVKCKVEGCFVIDTYVSGCNYLGSSFLHHGDGGKAKKAMAKSRRYWRKGGYEVVR